ncbi:MAG: PHP domain-containing protein [Acidobacteriota bacterium]
MKGIYRNCRPRAIRSVRRLSTDDWTGGRRLATGDSSGDWTGDWRLDRRLATGDRRLIAALALLSQLVSPCLAQTEQGYQPFHAAIHVHSTVSNGQHTPEQLAAFARARQVDVLVVTDSYLTRVRYGLPLFRWLIGREFNRPGVVDFGVARYLQAMRDAEAAQPGLVVVPGVEVAPFYHWQGYPFRDLKLLDFERHLLVIGMMDAVRLEKLPLIANPLSESLKPAPLDAVPGAALVAAGVALFFFRRKKTIRLKLYKVSQRVRYRKSAVALVALGALMLVSNYPFRRAPWEPYSGSAGIAPYQQLIDHVEQHGGLVFWSYPEARFSNIRTGGATLVTEPHPRSLVESRNYHGFEALYGDRISVTEPGNSWDEALQSFCRGELIRPPWGITGLDFHDFKGGWFELTGGHTILWMHRNTLADVLEALRLVRMYADFQADRNRQLRLDQWSVGDEAGSAISGEVLETPAPSLTVRCRLSRSSTDGAPIQLRLIRSGAVVAATTFPPDGGNFEFVEKQISATPMYYRLMIKQSNTAQIVSNPIFAVRSQVRRVHPAAR